MKLFFNIVDVLTGGATCAIIILVIVAIAELINGVIGRHSEIKTYFQMNATKILNFILDNSSPKSYLTVKIYEDAMIFELARMMHYEIVDHENKNIKFEHVYDVVYSLLHKRRYRYMINRINRYYKVSIRS